MYTLGIVGATIGVLMVVIGYALNTSTPVQQPLPVVGAVLTILSAICIYVWM